MDGFQMKGLKLCTGDSSENLPDTFDIDSVSESRSSGESASLKLKNVAGEVSGSSSAIMRHHQLPFASLSWRGDHSTRGRWVGGVVLKVGKGWGRNRLGKLGKGVTGGRV
ncbi:hypothetical protein CsSME_00044068 [Camellia sinensis var. sinensis]